MRVQSIVSAFIIVLGNGVLHLQMAWLGANVEVPKQKLLEELTQNFKGEYTCVTES